MGICRGHVESSVHTRAADIFSPASIIISRLSSLEEKEKPGLVLFMSMLVITKEHVVAVA